MAWRLALITAALLALAGCSDSQRHFDVDRALYPVKGIDVSNHNGHIDFDRARADSVEFVYIKATEGIDYSDPMFAHHLEGAKAAGLKVGAYHYFRFGSPGHLQAYHFLNATRGSDLDLPLAIDVEDWLNDDDVPDTEVREQLRVMVDALASNGMRVVIYTNKGGYARYIDSHFPDADLWICSLSSTPPKAQWSIWQHSHQGTIDGVSTPVDINAFAGTRADFALWLDREVRMEN